MPPAIALSYPPRRLSPRARTFAKAVTWQAVGIVCSVSVAFVITGSLATGGQFALASAALGTVLFVLHEWLWDRLG